MKEERLQRGLSRNALGAKLGVSGEQMRKYEIGKDAVPLHRLLNFAKVCGVSPETLWGHATAAPVPNGVSGADDINILQLVRAYRRISNAEQRRRILLLVKQMAGDDEKSADP
jgi:transcriptional regulator with XRE-family HTH domain